jgi:hypothetical protein
MAEVISFQQHGVFIENLLKYITITHHWMAEVISFSLAIDNDSP